jgi:hypothetical protein
MVDRERNLEDELKSQYGTPIPLTDSEIFYAILKGWESADDDRIPMFYARSFSDEEIEAMKNRKQRDNG